MKRLFSVFLLVVTSMPSHCASADIISPDSLSVYRTEAGFRVIDDCIIPQNVRVGGGTSTSKPLGWNTVVGSAIRYRVRWRQVGAPDWVERPVTPNPYDNITQLTNATTYEAQVQTICNGLSTNYSGSVTFMTACIPPEGGYAYNVTLTTALVSWGDFGEGTTYELRWRTAGTTSWPNTLVLSGSSYQFNGLTPRTTYEYQLRTLCPDGNQSDYLPLRAFTTTDCLQPTNLREIDPVESRIQLAWSVNYDQQVDLRWRIAGSSNWTVVPNLPTSNPTQGNGQTSGFYSLSGLTNGTVYEWGVQTLCNPNSRSSFTQSRSFTAVCAVPGYLSEYQLLPTSAEVFWRAVDGITYRLQWRPKDTTDTTWRTQPDRTMTGNALMIAKIDGLLAGSVYEWRVMTRCPAGNNSGYTAPRSFQTACGPPINVGIVFATATSAHVEWNSLSPTTQYRVRWRRDESTVWTESSLTDNEYYDITGLQTTSKYIAQVQAICNGQAGNYSANSLILTWCNTPIRLSISNVTDTSAKLGWGAFDGVSSYQLQWRPLGVESWPQSVTISAVGTYTPTGLMPGTPYEWRLRLLCTDGSTSAFTDIGSFTTTGCSGSVTSTLRNGDWTDPTMWSCQRIPTATDNVHISHVVHVHRVVVAPVRSLRYGAGGRLILGDGVKLRIGM